jgi:hypothetical protein
MSNSNNGVWFGHNKDGYEQLSVPYQSETVSVHQLLAIADGADPHKVYSDGEYVTHHVNEIPWFNTHNNVKVITKGKHNQIHKPREIITKNDCKHIRNSDKTIEELAEEFDLSCGGIAKHIYGECSHFENPSREKAKGPRKGPWRNKDLFTEMYKEKGKTAKELAKEWGCSTSTVYSWKKKHSV